MRVDSLNISSTHPVSRNASVFFVFVHYNSKAHSCEPLPNAALSCRNHAGPRLTRDSTGHNVLPRDQVKIANLGESHETKSTRSERFLTQGFHQDDSRRRRRSCLDRAWYRGSAGARTAGALGQGSGRRCYWRGSYGSARGHSSDRRRGVCDSDRRKHGCRRARDLERWKRRSGRRNEQAAEIRRRRFARPFVLGPDGLVGRGTERVSRLQVQRQGSHPRLGTPLPGRTMPRRWRGRWFRPAGR